MPYFCHNCSSLRLLFVANRTFYFALIITITATLELNVLINRKKRQLINDPNSYFYLQQRKKSRNKVIKNAFIVIILSILVAASIKAYATNVDSIENNTDTYVNGPRLVLSHDDLSSTTTLPVDIKANVNISGLIAYTELTQVFINPYATTLDGNYQFPLPENSAVQHLSIKIGDKEIVGKIMEKKAARKSFIQAKKQGKKASLVEQKRANIFSNKIANIPPQSHIRVTIKIIMPVDFSHGVFDFRLPLAITKRYHPNDYQHSPAESRQTLPTQKPKAIAPSQASINIALNAGVPISTITSTSHHITTQAQNNASSDYLVTLNKGKVLANRDFQLSWQLTNTGNTQVSSFSEQINNEYFTLLTFFPPVQQHVNHFARDIIFIIDTSGSMQGHSIEQAKQSLKQALRRLSKQDSFNIIAFESNAYHLFKKTQMVTDSSITRALEFVDALAADGGTEMFRPLSSALMMNKNEDQTQNAIRQLVFITDGAVANEFELMKLLNETTNKFRLFTIGIGSAPNGYFMKKAAQFGRGSYVFIQNTHEVESKISTLMAKISQPSITDIQLNLDQKTHKDLEIFPQKLPDLYAGEPLQVAIKSQLPIDSIELNGNANNDTWQYQLFIDDKKIAPGTSSLWARKKIEDLLDTLVIGANKNQVKQDVIQTSIAHQIISPYTSFLAVEQQIQQKTLLAKQQRKQSQKGLNQLMQAHETLLIAMPKTALGWQQQLIFGFLLMLLALVINKNWRKFNVTVTK